MRDIPTKIAKLLCGLMLLYRNKCHVALRLFAKSNNRSMTFTGAPAFGTFWNEKYIKWFWEAATLGKSRTVLEWPQELQNIKSLGFVSMRYRTGKSKSSLWARQKRL